jgi:two-component system chemotaxis response regulator CheV
MTRVSNILLDKEILLESGTNELEILVFDLADFTFGINVAKVREILPATQITSLPRAQKAIRGVFKLRNQVIPCVSLLDHLEIQPTSPQSESTLILTDFNQQQTAFLVDRVERIHRLSWESILSVPGILAMSNTPVTSMARCGDRLVVMLDFEMILDRVTERYFRQESVENPHAVPRDSLRLLLADDSPTVREAIGTTLRNSGYTNLRFFENGADAWKWISTQVATGGLESVGDLLISDVEMPQIDGLHLTKRIKEHPQLKQLPVLLYSSIVTPDNHKKGQAVGADAQVSKPELSKVVQLADELIAAARVKQGHVAATIETKAMEPKVTETNSAPKSQAKPQSNPVGASGTSTLSSQSAPATPSKIDPQLWQTFHRELTQRVAKLHELLAFSAAGSSEMLNALFRTLHTIKSAAMVVPVDAVSRATHALETLLEGARAASGQWPDEAIRGYVAWLDEVVAAGKPEAKVLDKGIRLAESVGEPLLAAAS